jgi:SAM-dependent methyltransferase
MTSDHWDRVWDDRHPDEVTWFQVEPKLSLRLIQTATQPDGGIIDIGGGASRLVDHLLDAGYEDITVVDIAPQALQAARDRLGPRSKRVNWIVGDATETDFGRTFDVWHDRAVFHFLTDEGDRRRYLATLAASIPVGGHVVLATFGPDGPEYCSGLPVRRYSIELMQETLGDGFVLIDHEIERHVAPNGAIQQFLYALFHRTR